MPYPTRHPPAGPPAGFTLVELLVTIGIVVFLMVGVASVFRITGDTIGAGQAASALNRDARAAQAVFAQDLQGAVTNGPFFSIQSDRVPAFLNKKDQDSDRDFDPKYADQPIPFTPAGEAAKREQQILSKDINGDGTEGDPNVFGEVTTYASISGRNHRTDQMSFFSRALRSRQTGPDGAFLSPTTSGEAWIRYQHMQQLRTDGGSTWDNVGEGPNNQYSSQFVLGRSAVLLLDNPPAGDGYYALPNSRISSSPNYYYKGDPLYQSTNSTPDSSNKTWNILSNRYDLAQTSIAEYKKTIYKRAFGGPGLNSYDGWWTRSDLNGNMRVYPYPTRPITSQQAAQTFPIFLRGCSQFIVEYAGDFVKQNDDPTDKNSAGVGDAAGVYGDVQDIYGFKVYVRTGGGKRDVDPYKLDVVRQYAGSTDGVTDFLVDADGHRQIRWYGFPRDVNGDGSIPGFAAGRRNNDLTDVVPLRDVMMTWNAIRPAGATPVDVDNGATFEHFWIVPVGTTSYSNTIPLPTGSAKLPNGSTAANDYDAPYLSDSNTGLLYNSRYTCVWGPDSQDEPKPQLVRITITLVDPDGALPDGQTYQFVYRVP